MKKVILFLCLLIVMSLACNASVNIAPASPALQPTNTMSPAIEPATTTPEIFISLTQAMPSPVDVSVDPLTITISPALASGASGIQVPRADGQDLPYFEITPGHTILKLEGYLLQDKFHEPQIYVYPAQGYAELVPGAFESMHRLRNVMNESIASIRAEQLPAVPFFNAAQVFVSNVQLISFQNGQGVRFLTEYAQYAASANNHDLFYHFQGFGDDGTYYIIAIFPITAPVLAETSDAGAVLPFGGIEYPDINSSNPDFPKYYASITDLLNTTAPEAFTPALSQLDTLIQSMRITP